MGEQKMQKNKDGEREHGAGRGKRNAGRQDSKRVPGTLQALCKRMHGSFIYLRDICLVFAVCQVL